MTAENIVNEFNGLGELTENEKLLVEKIKQYGKEKCEEQRNLCASQFINEYESQICYNSPEPEFD